MNRSNCISPWKVTLSFLLLVFSYSAHAILADQGDDAPEDRQNVINKGDLARVPLHFVKNEGQTGKEILYHSIGGALSPLFTDRGVRFTVQGNTGHPLPLGLLFDGITGDAIELVAENPAQARINYFIGSDPSKWKTRIPTFLTIRYRNVWRGVDVLFYEDTGGLRYDIILEPGVNPNVIRLRHDGARRLALNEEGDLEIWFDGGRLLQRKPFIYQEIGTKRIAVAGHFLLHGNNTYGFSIDGAYDPRYPLVIDPLLDYATLLGGRGYNDEVRDIAVDPTGRIYVAVAGTSSDLTVSGGAAHSGSWDAYIALLDPSKTGADQLISSTYLGGLGVDVPSAIRLDSTGKLHVAGYTDSSDFPATSGVFQASDPGSGNDGFVSILSADLSTLVSSTYLGGIDSREGIADIEIASSTGNVYVTGSTCSSDFPVTTSAYQSNLAANCPTGPGPGDAFLTVLTADLKTLVYSTYLGGTSFDGAGELAVDSSGKAYIAGSTRSTNFPVTTGAYQTTSNGNIDAFIAAIDPAQNGSSSLAFSTYLGGSADDASSGIGIALETGGNIIITGNTYSSDFPITSSKAYQETYGGAEDAFLVILSSDLGTLHYSSYLGASSSDIGHSVMVDNTGRIYVTGVTLGNIPITQGAIPQNGTFRDAFAAIFDPSLAGQGSLVFFTYVGGPSDDYSVKLALDTARQGRVYITGRSSDSTDFPVTQGAYQETPGSDTRDGFIARIDFNADLAVTKSSNPTTVSTGETLTYTINLTNNGPATATGVRLVDTLPSAMTFSSATASQGNCTEVAGTVTCDVGILQSGENATIELEATAGATTGTFDNTVTVSSNMPDPDSANNSASISTIVIPRFTLTINKSGSGSGSVTSSPAGIDCGTVCSTTFAQGENVSLAAAPDTGSVFSAWGGDCAGSDATTSITMNDDKTCTASFDTQAPQNQAPPTPTLLSPQDGATGLAATVTFSWQSVDDPDGDTVSYRFCLRAGDNQFDEAADCTPVSQQSASWDGKQDMKTLYAGLGIPGAGLLGALMVLSIVPRHRRQTLWSAGLILAASLISACSGGGGGNDGQSTTPSPGNAGAINHMVSGLSASTTYYWKVIAQDSQGGRADSEVWRFTTS